MMAQYPPADPNSKSKQLNEVIARHIGTRGALIPVLHEAQNIYGYLPLEVQLEIAKQLHLPLAEVYGVVKIGRAHV